MDLQHRIELDPVQLGAEVDVGLIAVLEIYQGLLIDSCFEIRFAAGLVVSGRGAGCSFRWRCRSGGRAVDLAVDQIGCLGAGGRGPCAVEAGCVWNVCDDLRNGGFGGGCWSGGIGAEQNALLANLRGFAENIGNTCAVLLQRRGVALNPIRTEVRRFEQRRQIHHDADFTLRLGCFGGLGEKRFVLHGAGRLIGYQRQSSGDQVFARRKKQ